MYVLFTLQCLIPRCKESSNNDFYTARSKSGNILPYWQVRLPEPQNTYTLKLKGLPNLKYGTHIYSQNYVVVINSDPK